MGGRQHQALRGIRMSELVGFPAKEADRGVRIGDVAVAIVHCFHRGNGFIVGRAVAPDFLLHIFEPPAAQVEQTRKIIRVSHVHGVRIRSRRGPRAKFTRPQILRYDIVDIRRGHKLGYRQADAFGKNPCRQVAEIPAGHGHDQRHRRHRQLPVRRHVVEHLRKKPRNIDGICRSQKRALVELRIGKSLLHQPLAIVKRAGHFERGDVFAERGELLFLRLANALGRIEDHHTDSRHAQEAVRYRAAGVTRGRHQHGQRPRLAANEIAHQPRHKPRAKILER